MTVTSRALRILLLLGAFLHWNAGCTRVLLVQPGDQTIEAGGSVEITAKVIEGPALGAIPIKIKRKNAIDWETTVPMKKLKGEFRHTIRNIRETTLYLFDVPAENPGPYTITVKTLQKPVEYQKGFEAGTAYRDGRLRDYRLVIMLQGLRATAREDFLTGFVAAFREVGKSETGRKYAEVLREAVRGDHYDLARQQGQKHAKDLVTDAQIQNLIRRTLGVSGGVALGWKAGYIRGFMEQKAEEISATGRTVNDALKEKLYEQARAMYSALRAATGN